MFSTVCVMVGLVQCVCYGRFSTVCVMECLVQYVLLYV